MSLDETHYEEANRARDRLERETTLLRRLLWLRVLVLVVLALVTFAHTTYVYRLNQSLRMLGHLSDVDRRSSVIGFLAHHRIDANYTLAPDAAAISLQRILGSIGRVLQEDVTLATNGKDTMEEVLERARDRPESIKGSFPYIGEVRLPVTFSILALLCGLFGILSNLFIVVREHGLDALEAYIAAHLGQIGVESTGQPLVRFRADPGTEAVRWPPSLSKSDARTIVELLTGLSLGHLQARRMSMLLEVGSAAVSTVCILGSFAMFTYLVIEGWVGRWSDYFVLPAALTVGVTAAVGSVVLVARLGHRLSDSPAVIAGSAQR